MKALIFSWMMIVLAAAAAGAGEDAWRRWMDRGSVAEIAGDYAGALAAYREAALLAATFDRIDPRRVLAFNAQGMMYDALGRFTDADASFRKALDALDAIGTGPSLNRAVLLANLANVVLEMGHGARAEKLLRESVAMHLALAQPDPMRLAIARNSLAEFLTVSGRLSEASAVLERSLAAIQNDPEAGTEIGIGQNNLGAIRLYQGRYAEGQAILERSLASLEAVRGPNHPILLRTLHNLAVARERNGQSRSAGQAWRRAIDLAEASLGLEHPLYGEILGNYASYLRQNGDKKTGKTLAARSADILRDHQRRNGVGGVVDVTSLQQRAK